jgi:hypothetical protein
MKNPFPAAAAGNQILVLHPVAINYIFHSCACMLHGTLFKYPKFNIKLSCRQAGSMKYEL